MHTTAPAKWLELWRRLGVSTSSVPAFSPLQARYAEPHRAYHNLAHITDCFEQFAPVRSLAKHADAVELALWYHDVIYDPRAKDNEERSAELAVADGKQAGLPAVLLTKVSNLIMATKKHDASLDVDAPLMTDVDLSILGREAARFDAYEVAIRAEYSWVPADAFVAGRSAVLEAFLARPFIYHTDHFRSRLEAPARQNLARSLARLASDSKR